MATESTPNTSRNPGRNAAAPLSPDVRKLGLVQLKGLADGGSRRARAELDRRMRAADARQTPPLASAVEPPPSAVDHGVPSPVALPAADDSAAVRRDARIEQWALIERQELQRSREDGPPRLVGLVLIIWGALLGLGGLLMLARGGGTYYLLSGVAAAGVGVLLMRCSRWALRLHAVTVLLALVWAWLSAGALTALLQAAPLWIAALWAAVPAVREPLR